MREKSTLIDVLPMEFRTKVGLQRGEDEIRHSDCLMLWGSCFAENVGRKLLDYKFDCDINPFGILYNPLSIAEGLSQLRRGKIYTEEDLRHDRGVWYSLMHHGSFSSASKEDCLAVINSRLRTGKKYLERADWLLFTWGTAWVYEWKEDGRVVGNCHKLSERMFSRRLLEVGDIESVYIPLLSELYAANPRLNVLFTVSPIRHIRDGMHGNQLSKSTLLLAVSHLCRRFPFCHYFPSYEIMMDELRDYRFYADDMLHPTPLAVDYIWECFSEVFFSPATCRVMKQWEEIRKGLSHRPFDAESVAYRSFLSQILLKIEELKKKFPYLDVRKEVELCQAQLKK